VPNRIPEETRDAVKADIREGVLSAAEIGKKHGVARSTVCLISKEITPPAGREWFDRAITKKATAVAHEDLKARRARIVEKILTRVEQALDQMDRPYLVYNFGGKDNTYNEKVLDAPPTQAMKDLMTIVGIGSQRAVELIKFDDAGTHGEHVGLLQAIGNELRARYGDGSEKVAGDDDN
jgi:hypothetical protein